MSVNVTQVQRLALLLESRLVVAFP